MSEVAGYSYRDGRIWVQEKKFQPYQLLLPYGLTDISDPVGSLNAVRQPSRTSRGDTEVVDVLRGEPALPGFTIETRLFKTLNYMFKWRLRPVNFQVHLGECGRPDTYRASEVALHWDIVRRGDLGADRTAIIQGDDAPVSVNVPWMAEVGPMFIDWGAEFVSRINFAEGEAITDISMLTDDCDDITYQEDPGDVGYLVSKSGAGLYIQANVWYTLDAWETPIQVSTNPFTDSEDISSVLTFGLKEDHRVIVSRGTADGAAAAEVAVADVLEPGTVTWSNYDVGSTLGEHINHMAASDYGHIYAVSSIGNIYLSKDGGTTWVLKKQTNLELNEVSALPSGIVWAVGNTQRIWLSEDYGESWSQVTAPTALTNDVNTVHVTPDGTVYVGDSDGQLFGSYDDGDNWTTLQAQGVTPTAVTRIRGHGNSHIWLVVAIAGGASRVLRSTDGGASFLLWNLNLPTNSGLNALFLVDQNYAMVGGEAHSGQAFLSKTKTNVLG